MDFSPTDSLLSASDEAFVSLFGDEGTAMSPADSILTPPRSVDGNTASNSSRNSTQEPEKKPAKKRKSWGQELPTPTTNLPPRKRAKTEAEKEQRRIERVLRNRAAAQSSRERKRKEVEALEDEKADIERENQRLNSRLVEVEQQNLRLSRQIADMAAKMTVFQQQLSGGLATPESSTRSVVSPIISQADSTFGVESVKLEYEQDLDFSLPPPHSTLDPNALLSSPSEASIDDPTATTLDLTQHPAEVLCDQQCQSRVTRPQWGQAMELSDEQSRHMAFLTLVMTLTQLLFLTMSSTVFSLLHHPLHQIFSSLKTGNPLPISSTTSMTTEAYSISRLILWLTSTPPNHPSATTTLSLNKSRENQRATFRIRLLERLLACSPALARPLKDATAAALQLVSDSIAEPRSERSEVDSLAVRREAASLMTMLWAIESIGDSQRKCRSDSLSRRREDPAGDIRRLCMALDGLSNGNTGGGKASKDHGEWDGGQGSESLTTRRLASLDLDFSVLAGKYGTGL
ncbi:hypothetical protein FGG08_001995 [Glutinoglossum americanum]|uniref:BZIP domain-containing protein n=1 Tax=Glutinoglossum americanum TaxID=1670608 RepID=A0A9P8I736_9PEZI|nr:hypothetical protein FGG08_001995 [Glutinoglossum americanum]